MTTPLRAAIIGVGGISASHYEGYRAAGVEVTALCDVNPEALRRRQMQWGVSRGFTDADALFRAGGFDMVSVAAPTAAHHAATLAAAAAGVHVLTEKPFALDLAVANEMITACHSAGVVLMVNHQLRSHAPVVKAQQLISEGAIGRITSIRLRQAHDWGGASKVGQSFSTRAVAGGGTLLDNGCHLADLARLLGGEVANVFARTPTLKFDVEVEDTAHASLLFESGAIGVIETAWTATGWEEGFWVQGTEGALEYTNRAATPTLRHLYRQSPGSSWDKTDVAEYTYTGAGAHTRHVMAFVRAVQGLGPNVCTGLDGLEAVRLILAAYRSAKMGRPVAVKDVLA